MTWPKWRRFLREPLAMALVCSLAIHGTAALTWKLGWWRETGGSGWLSAIHRLGAADPARMRQALEDHQQRRETRMTFVEVDPAAAAEPPEQARNYGAVSTRAANPDPVPRESDTPELAGRELPFVSAAESRPQGTPTETPPANIPLQPDRSAPRPTDEREEADQEARAGGQETREAGETLMAKADERPRSGTAIGVAGEGSAARATRPPRPRTVAEARARLGGPSGDRSRMTGGVALAGRGSLDVKGTMFGSYDAAFVDAVREAWFQVLGTRPAGEGGEVQIRFNLRHDGDISDLVVVKSTVNDLLTYYCRRAIEIPAKYEPWPAQMRREIGSDKREITFTFHYLQ